MKRPPNPIAPRKTLLPPPFDEDPQSLYRYLSDFATPKEAEAIIEDALKEETHGKR